MAVRHLCHLHGRHGGGAGHQYSVAAKMLSCDQTFADRFMSATGLDGALPWLFGIYATCMDATVAVLG
ncbi:disulfide bond formation protein B, partial [Bordetella pertussis]